MGSKYLYYRTDIAPRLLLAASVYIFFTSIFLPGNLVCVRDMPLSYTTSIITRVSPSMQANPDSSLCFNRYSKKLNLKKLNLKKLNLKKLKPKRLKPKKSKEA